MSRNEAGEICGRVVATTLSRYAAPVPKPISVNILGLRWTTDAQKRWKNGQPPHTTTGVARTNWSQLRAPDDRGSLSASPNMAISKTGRESAALTQNRRNIESYSGSASTSAKASIGSSAMPQIGQDPGPSWTICGCIGQV